VDKQKTRQ